MHHLPHSFFIHDDVVSIARLLVGKIIWTSIDGQITSGRIVETEAYRGRDDKGCHSFIHGKTTKTKAMFDRGGVSYVYICYGIHKMINIVTNQKEQADAVLIRAIKPLEGESIMERRRGKAFKKYHLSGGPGKVCQCLGITMAHNNIDLSSSNSPVQILDDHYTPVELIATPRVGMSRRVGDYSNKPWRFYEKDNAFVSRPLTVHYPWD